MLFVAGGTGSDGAVTNSAEFYDPGANAWRDLPPMPIALTGAAGVAYRDEFIVIGGFTDAARRKPSARVFAFSEKRWRALPSLRRARGALGATAVGTRIVVAGGRGTTGLVKTTEVFNGATWNDGPAIPTPRERVAMSSDGIAAFVFGGAVAGRAVRTVERYDPVLRVWRAVRSMPVARAGAVALRMENRFLLAGGVDAAGALVARVDALFMNGRWDAVKVPMPTARADVGGGVVLDIGYVVGGSTVGSTAVGDLQGLELADKNVVALKQNGRLSPAGLLRV